MSETISVEVLVNKRIDVDVRLDEVIDGINNCEMKRRWNYIAQLLNGISLDATDLTDDQKLIVEGYLENKLSLLKK